MKTIKKGLILDRAGVDAVSQEIAAWLTDLGLSGQERIRIRLTMEELLLRVSEHFEGKAAGRLFLGKSLGVPVIRFRYRGEAFDPIRAAGGHDNDMTVWTDTLLARMGLSPSWHYRSGRNTLQIIFMAAMIGVLLVSAGDSGARVRELAEEDIPRHGGRFFHRFRVCRLQPVRRDQ